MRNHPRTLLAGALSVALMFAAGGVMAQDAAHDRTATENMDSDQPMSDTWITTKVKSSLLADSDVAGLDVEVETVNGVVHLRGDVDSQAQVDRAVEIARDIDGVTNVDSSSLNTAAGTSDF
ncbi:MAG TPA: BON domain-containing protein [Candidatus Luteimonas excrementigallinarum]|nr:BON domain-containing protein [Candidatus Luteimonas excrementigallinarum]